jgi:hypothetical protein
MTKLPEYQGRIVGVRLLEKDKQGGPLLVRIRTTFMVEEKSYTGYTEIVKSLKDRDAFPIGAVMGIDATVLQLEMEFPPQD